MTIKAAVFNGKYLLGVVTLADVPRRADYIQVPGQTYIGCVAEYVVLLDTNTEGWDILIVIGSHYVQHPTPDEFATALLGKSRLQRQRAESISWMEGVVANPNWNWQRRKDAYEARQAGIPTKKIAEEMGISTGRANQLIAGWRNLLANLESWKEAQCADARE